MSSSHDPKEAQAKAPDDAKRGTAASYETEPYPNMDVTSEAYAQWKRSYEEQVTMMGLAPADFEGLDVLDAGCGTGEFTIAHASYGCRHLVALDLNESSLDCLREKIRITGTSTIEVIHGDVLDPDVLGDRTFDVIYSYGMLHHTGDARRGFDNIARRLRPGGLMLFFVYNRWAHFFYERRLRILDREVGTDPARRVEFAKRNFKAPPEFRGSVEAGWFDRYGVSNATSHTVPELLSWFRDNELEFVNGFPLCYSDLWKVRFMNPELPTRPLRRLPFLALRRLFSRIDERRKPNGFRMFLYQAYLLRVGYSDYGRGIMMAGRKAE